MSESQLVGTKNHMVQDVLNIIDGYGMGAMRALAQEPVQNSKDAYRSSLVKVEYRLMRRETIDQQDCYMLSITDSGTKGLSGPCVLTDAEMEERGDQIHDEEHWLAFEAQGFTKHSKDAHGSRGQGKAAFLYYSNVPGDHRRMLMLYDTKLPGLDGEYRFGLRLARPSDVVRKPPLLGDAARKAITMEQFDVGGGLFVPLSLKPLSVAGTRIIIPFVDNEVVEAFRSGTLARWLQRCWWRAIQAKDVEIIMVDEEQEDSGKPIEVPPWWQGEPWKTNTNSGNVFVRRWEMDKHGKKGEEVLIKRLVLLYDPNLNHDEIVDDPDQPEYGGIQLMRKRQWVETRGALDKYGSFISEENSAGFRGFVEFDQRTDRDLRSMENSQHDEFKGKYKKVVLIREYLKDKVGEFAQEIGWVNNDEEYLPEDYEHENQILNRFADRILAPISPDPVPDPNKLYWTCNLELKFPNCEIGRVNWGRSISDVSVGVIVKPADNLHTPASLLLEWVDATRGKVIEIAREESVVWRTNTTHSFGDWQLVKGRATQKNQIACPIPGKYLLRVAVIHSGERVAETHREVFVQQDRPQPISPDIAQSLSIRIGTLSSPNQQRFKEGDNVYFQIVARNYEISEKQTYITARIVRSSTDPGKPEWVRDLVLYKPLLLSGAMGDDSPKKVLSHFEQFQLRRDGDLVNSSGRTETGNETLLLQQGKYYIQANLYADQSDRSSLCGERKAFYFMQDVGNAESAWPFSVKPNNKEDCSPLWKLNTDMDELLFNANHPIYKQLPIKRRLHSPTAGHMAFIFEVAIEGLLEWALRPLEDLQNRGESNIDQLRDAIKRGNASSSIWERYRINLEDLARMTKQGSNESRFEYAAIKRETVALLLSILNGG